MKKTRKIALIGLLAGLCFALSYLEFMLPLPTLGVPGVKAGIANICVLIALWLYGAWAAAGVNLVRIVLCWLIFGSFTGLMYSLAGAALSLAVMLVLKRTGLFSPVGVSAAGGAMHNVAQLAVAAALTETSAIWYYLPVLLISGTAAGAFNGAVFRAILGRLKRRPQRDDITK